MLRQIIAVTGLNFTTLPQRWGTSLVVVLSLAGVVGVMVALLAMAAGLEKTLALTGSDDRVVVLRSGQTQEWQSRISRAEAELLLTVPGLERDRDGTPLASLETISVARLRKKGDDLEASVGIRGVGDQVLNVRPEIRLIEGRFFTSGTYELLAGRAARHMFQGLELGAKIRLGDASWTVVGVFEADGGAHESELWADTQLVMSTLNRNNAYNSLIGLLASDSAFAQYQAGIETHPTLALTAVREPEFFAAQQSDLTSMIRGFGYAVAVIMALGAMFSAVNALYASVRGRTVEIATLRALGFGAAPVVISVLLEGLLLCLAGGLLGGALAYPLFNGYTVSSSGQNLGQVAFAFSVDGRLLLEGLVLAVVIGLLGSLMPALRAARLPVAEALRPT